MTRPPHPTLDRERALDRAADRELDVLVVGGGITGAGVALDAATRGLRTALVERDDLASGTSSRSSKLVHGGIRYLAQGDVTMVAEAVRERDRLRRLAPHLVRPLPFALPTPSWRRRGELKAAMLLYDALAFGRNVARHRRLPPAALLHDAPALSDRIGRGGYRYFDCRTDDARLTVAVAMAAARFGADIANHAEVVELLRVGDRVTGAVVRDRLSSNRDVVLRARWVVSASGVWADRIRGLAPRPPDPTLTPSRGVHLAFPRTLLPLNGAVVFPSGHGDGRTNFAIPWGQQVYIGTNDVLHCDGLDEPAVRGNDARYLLESAAGAFGIDLSLADAIGAWAGLRPLLVSRSRGGAPKDLSRRHAIVEDPPGLVTVTGGKLTTFRQMAEDVVDLLAARDGERRRCVTTRIRLGVRGTVSQGRARVRAVARHLGYGDAVSDPMFERYGDAATTVLESCRRNGEDDLLVPTLPYLSGEVRWAVRAESARTLGDVLDRRLRVTIRDRAAGGAGIQRAATIMADELSWDDDRMRSEVAAYLAFVAQQRGPVPLDRSWLSAEDVPVGQS